MKVTRALREGQPATSLEVESWRGSRRSKTTDSVAAEEPLEIRLAGCSVAVTMRTPGEDFDLALGFLFTEGIIQGRADVSSIAHCPAPPEEESPDELKASSNVVNVNPRDPTLVQPDTWQRNFYATSSCGICGKASINAVRQEAEPIDSNGTVQSDTLYRLNTELRRAQTVFGDTGGLHGAGLFDLSGHLVALREDVGRHNAVDKIIGHALGHDALPLRDHLLMVSGRASFEIVQKALMAGIPIVASVSAPSSLAVDLARCAKMTLVGFLRDEGPDGQGRFNVYTGHERIAPSSEAGRHRSEKAVGFAR